MPAIRTIDSIADKWKRVTPLRAQDYAIGVANPKKDWAIEATKANDVYVRAVTAAAQGGRYAGGVRRAGTAKWQERAKAKGPTRFSEGVLMAGTDYQEGFAPFHDVIAKTEIPPKLPTGDPGNIQRVMVIAKALHDKKVALRK